MGGNRLSMEKPSVVLMIFLWCPVLVEHGAGKARIRTRRNGWQEGSQQGRIQDEPMGGGVEGLIDERKEKKGKCCMHWTAMLNWEGSPKISLSFMWEPRIKVKPYSNDQLLAVAAETKQNKKKTSSLLKLAKFQTKQIHNYTDISPQTNSPQSFCIFLHLKNKCVA